MRSLRRRVGGKEQEAKEGGGQGAGGQGGRSKEPLQEDWGLGEGGLGNRQEDAGTEQDAGPISSISS